MKTGAEQISAERARQVEVEGHDDGHDSNHRDGELAYAAMCYAAPCHAFPNQDFPALWPWDYMWWKPSRDPVRNLVKAGALIAAEIDRLQRMQERGA